MYTVIGIIFLTTFVSSQNLNCTKLTMACPTAAKWAEIGNYFNCTGHKSYVCLMTSTAELREGCIFDSMILAGQIGCPNTKQCDNRTDQPLLVTENNYLPCPPDLKGCPPRNHSGYSILKIYKYPRCQGNYISEESSVSPNTTTDTILPARISRHEILRRILYAIFALILFIAIVITIIICRDKIKDKDTKDVNFKARAVNIFSILSKPKKNNTGKKRTELQLPTRQQSYQVKDTSQTSSPDVVIETEHQDNNKGFVQSRDLDAEIVVYNGNLYISTTVNRETSQSSPPDVTTEAEDLDNIENMIVWKGPRIRSSHASCSSSDSDRSQTPMLKEISKTKRQQPIRHHSNLPLSPQTLPK